MKTKTGFKEPPRTLDLDKSVTIYFTEFYGFANAFGYHFFGELQILDYHKFCLPELAKSKTPQVLAAGAVAKLKSCRRR